MSNPNNPATTQSGVSGGKKTSEKTRKRKMQQKKRRRDILIALAVFALVAAVVVLILRFSLTVDSITLTEPLYKYQVTERIDFDGRSTLSYDDGVPTLENGGRSFRLDAEPLYLANSDAVVLPQDMILVLPDRPLLARAQHFSTLTNTDSGVQLLRGKSRTMISRGFLYDGRDRYLFLSAVKLVWGEAWAELSPLSYVVVQPDQTLLYLNHETGACVILDTGICRVQAVSESGYKVDLTNDAMTLADGREILLFADPAALEPLAEK